MTVHPRVLVTYQPSPEERDAFGETLAGLATIGYLPQVAAGDRAGKPDAIFINVARAAIVDEDALYEHLLRTPSFSAGIDVWWQEPHGAARSSPGTRSWTCRTSSGRRTTPRSPRARAQCPHGTRRRTWRGTCVASRRGTSSTAPSTSPHLGDGTRGGP
jgi:D-isomer specific 2-hydroxyacid dehydrogenase, NAD binding domain